MFPFVSTERQKNAEMMMNNILDSGKELTCRPVVLKAGNSYLSFEDVSV